MRAETSNWVDSVPHFGEEHYRIIRRLVRELPKAPKRIVKGKFWEELSLTDLAQELHLTWESVSERLNDTLAQLREGCLKSQTFLAFAEEKSEA